MANFRELNRVEKKQFRIFEQGYVEGLKAVSPLMKLKKDKSNFAHPNDEDCQLAFKDKIIFFKRNKANYVEFHEGYVAGYFRSLTSELPRAFLDPELNEDIHEYLENTWLHDKIFGKEER